LYARVAGAHDYALVPEHLVGYRDLPGNMSSNRLRMLRSHMLMCDQMLALHPQHTQAIERGLQHYGFWLLCDARPRVGLLACVALWWVLLRRQPRVAMRILLKDMPLDPMRRLRGRLGRWRRGHPPPSATEARRLFLSPPHEESAIAHE
jgi:hypothetical protein